MIYWWKLLKVNTLPVGKLGSHKVVKKAAARKADPKNERYTVTEANEKLKLASRYGV